MLINALGERSNPFLHPYGTVSHQNWAYAGQEFLSILTNNAMITDYGPCFDYGDHGNEKKLDGSMCTTYQAINQGD